MKKYILLVAVVFIGCNCFGQKKEIHLFGITTDSSNYVKLSIDTCFLPDWIHLDSYADIKTQINEIIKQSYDKGWNDKSSINSIFGGHTINDSLYIGNLKIDLIPLNSNCNCK